MGSFYKLDPRPKSAVVLDATDGGYLIDSTSGSHEDSTSTSTNNFRIWGFRQNVPYRPIHLAPLPQFYQQIPAKFQCPSGKVAYFTKATLVFHVQTDSTNVGDSSNGLSFSAHWRFFATNKPLDTTGNIWSPTNWVLLETTTPPSNTVVYEHTFTTPSPLNRPLYAGESVDLRVLPHNGPLNYCECSFEGYLQKAVAPPVINFSAKP